MPSRDLPREPSLEHLRNQAKALHRAVLAGEPAALALAREFHPAPHDPLTRTDAQLVIARQYGFASWPKLREHVALLARYTATPHRADPVTPLDEFLTLACLTYGGDDPARRVRARDVLGEHPRITAESIHAAAAAGDLAAAGALLDRDPGLADARGGPHRWEPLLYLAYSRVDGAGEQSLAVARLLLDAGANPNVGYLWEGKYAFTALTGVLGEGEDAPNQPRHPRWAALARLLLDRGADANDSQGLYNRQFGSSDDHLHLLFEFGLGTGNGGPWYTRFPDTLPSPEQMLQDQLLWAAERDLPERVELLLAHGADPDGTGFWFIKRPSTGTALSRALRRGNRRVADLLRNAGATPVDLKPVQELLSAALAGDRAGVDALAADDPDLVAAAIARSPQAVERAAALHRPNAVRLLVDLGFDVNARKRITALHEAASTGDLEMARLLVGLGADPALRDRSFDADALGWAEHGHHDEVAAYLAGLPGRAEPNTAEPNTTEPNT